jgi:hypothetical protein
MTSIRIRPRFNQIIKEPQEKIEARLKSKLKDPDIDCVGRVIPGFIVIKIPRSDRHYWSPQLSLSLEEHEDGTLVRGLYGPNPTVWAMFTFGYSALGLIALFISIIGFSKVSLGLEAPVLWALPILGGLAVILYFVAQTGQKIGVEQTFTIHHFYEESIGEKVHIE